MEYIGRNKFQVSIDLLDQYGGQSYIFTDPFEIDLSKYAELEDDSIKNFQENKKTLERNFDEVRKLLKESEKSESVIRSLLEWEVRAHIYEINKSLRDFGN